MRKVRLDVVVRVPSWDFCNDDKINLSLHATKETCRFCKKDKYGMRRCTLLDATLTEKDGLIYKHDACITATRNCGGTMEEQAPIPIDPQVIIKETLKVYTKTVDDLIAQGYPRAMAESLAKQYIEGSK